MPASDDLQGLELVVGRLLAVDDLPGSRAPACVVDGDEALVLGAHSHAQGIVLLRPDRQVEDGTSVA